MCFFVESCTILDIISARCFKVNHYLQFFVGMYKFSNLDHKEVLRTFGIMLFLKETGFHFSSSVNYPCCQWFFFPLQGENVGVCSFALLFFFFPNGKCLLTDQNACHW